MKKFIALLAIVALLLPSCQKINDRIDGLEGRIDQIEGTQIATINQQIEAINTTLPQLRETDAELKEYIESLQTTAANLQEQITATNEDIDELEAALNKAIADAEASDDALKTELVAQLNTAKTDILAQLESTKTALEAELAQINSTIATLQAKDTELEGKITALEEYVNTELQNTEDWAIATFATLEQYNTIVEDIATIKAQIETLNTSLTNLEERLNTKIATDIAAAVEDLQGKLATKVTEITTAYTDAISIAKEEVIAAYTEAIATAITNLESSMKQWVNEQLTGYYTIAEIDAQIEALRELYRETGYEQLAEDIESLEGALQDMKEELTEAYQKAIEDAINTNNGVIDGKIAEEVAEVNQSIANEIETINSRLDDLEERVSDLEGNIEDLMNRELEITFEDTENIAILAGSSYKVHYTITSSESEIHIATIAQNGWRASVTKSTEKTGYITVYAPNPMTIDPIIILVSDANTTIMRCLTFVDGFTSIITTSYALTNEATTLSVNVQTNLDYNVNIPSAASGWISLQDITTRATVRNDVINLNIKENTTTSSRKATLQLVCNDVEVGAISIYQSGVEVANNEITYTSSDGKIIEPYQTMGFKANIISNTYSNGLGVIVFDKDIAAISEYAFYNCSKLTSIQIPNSVTKISDYAFYGSGLTSLTIPDSVTMIGYGAFCYCSSLTSVTIPDSITTIGEIAFHMCGKLTSVSIGDSVTMIGELAFDYCKSLTCVYCKATTPPNLGDYDVFDDNASSRKIYVPTASVEAYKSASGWAGYKSDIIGYDFGE